MIQPFSEDQWMCVLRCSIEIKLLSVTTIEFQRFRLRPSTGEALTAKVKINNWQR